MSIGIGSSNRKVIEIKNIDGTVVSTISVSKPSKTKTKRLQYNYKLVSSQIMRAKTSVSARQAVTRARGMTAMLRKKMKSGDYDEKELEHAILHAERMARVAKKRMKHLQEEENAKKAGGVCFTEPDEKQENLSGKDMAYKPDREERKELMQKFQDSMQDLLTELENAAGLEEVLGGVQEDMEPADLERLKKKHRSDELREIAQADMEYLKALFGKLAKEKQDAVNGISLQLGGMEMPIPVAQMPAVIEGGSIDAPV